MITRDDLERSDRRQLACLADSAALPFELAFFLKRLEQALEFDPVAALDAEGACDLALADFPRAILDEIDDLVGRWQVGEEWLRLPRHGLRRSLCHAPPASCSAWLSWPRALPIWRPSSPASQPC